MENDIKLYQAGIKKLLSEYKALQTEWSEVELLFDDEHRHYMAYRVGWFRHRRIHFCLVHIDIVGDTVIIQANNTEDMIDEELIRLGIPKDRIRLGLLPPDLPVPPEEPDRMHPLHQKDISRHRSDRRTSQEAPS